MDQLVASVKKLAARVRRRVLEGPRTHAASFVADATRILPDSCSALPPLSVDPDLRLESTRSRTDGKWPRGTVDVSEAYFRQFAREETQDEGQAKVITKKGRSKHTR